jgi:hypothetical protein
VDCYVYDASGTLKAVISPVAKDAAVEVISKSFTGVDYKSGQIAASKPVPLQTVMDRWWDSAGALDWKVRVGGANRDISGALEAANLYINVKDGTYGATGDGATDDSIAIDAALTAAATNGGTVFFPPGTYRRTTTLTPAANVNLLGAGAGASTIAIDHATISAITLSNATGNKWQTIKGLTVRALQANTGSAIAVTGVVSLRLTDCVLGDSHTINGITATDAGAAAAILDIEGTDFIWTANGAGVNASRGPVFARGCRFTPLGGYAGTALSATAGLVADACVFVFLAATNTGACIAFLGASAPNTITGCDFQTTGGGVVYGLYCSDAPNNLCEAGNHFHSTITRYYFSPTTSTSQNRVGAFLGTREASREYITSNTSCTAHSQNNRMTTVMRSASTDNCIITLESPLGPGESFNLFIYNGSGFAIPNLYVNGAYCTSPKNNLPNTNTNVWTFVSADVNGALGWYAVATSY